MNEQTGGLMKVFVIGLMVILCAVLSNTNIFAQTRGEGWRLYYIDEPSRYYYDKGGIETPQKNINRVWIKITEKMRGDEELEKQKMRFQIDCRKKSYDILSSIEYDTVKGGVIKSEEYTAKPQKGDIRADARMNALIENVCP